MRTFWPEINVQNVCGMQLKIGRFMIDGQAGSSTPPPPPLGVVKVCDVF